MPRAKRGFTARRYTSPPRNITAPATLPEQGKRRKPGRPRKIELLGVTDLKNTTSIDNIIETRPTKLGTWSATLESIPAPAGITPAPYGSILSRRLALHFCMTHPIAFREYMIPKISPRGYWHRYSFSPVMLGAHQGDTVFRAGRGTGKSFAFLEPALVQHALTHPGEETMLTTLRKVHIIDRMERVIDYFMTPTLERYVKKIIRAPYTVQLHNGHTIYGIGVGDDPEARMAQGKHVSLLATEESQQYPIRAWIKVQGSKDPRGCRVLMIGVPDGRTDTPFRLADTQYPSFAGRRFTLSRRWDPYFNQKLKVELASVHGGMGSDLFKQEVDSLWGNPTWSAWDMETIYKCMNRDVELHCIRVDGRVYKNQGWSPIEALIDVPERPPKAIDVVMAADVGYTQPTEIGILVKFEHDGPWTLWCRVELVERMEHDAQSDVMWALAKKFKVSSIGIDATEGEGRALATELDNRQGREGFVTRISFTELLFVRMIQDNDGEPAEEFEISKSVGTRLLRNALSNRSIILPRDEQLVAEFNKEMEHATNAGVRVIRTPSDVHIPEMLRVFCLTLFLRDSRSIEDAGTPALPAWGFDPAGETRGMY